MARRLVRIVEAGLVSSVGLSMSTACAAIRAALLNHEPTRVLSSGGEWIVGAQVPLESNREPLDRLAAMAALAIDECLNNSGDLDPVPLPLLLCVAEPGRPGRVASLQEHLPHAIERELSLQFHPNLSATFAAGRVSVIAALAHARRLIVRGEAPRVLIAAADSLLPARTLWSYEQDGRLLSDQNSNGFVPGEAAGALLVASHAGPGPALVCSGLGFAREPAPLDSGQPLRAEGLTRAIQEALADANLQLHNVDFRITDNSGEQYYFKEAALALTRLLRVRKEEFDIWHPAECTGEVGAAIGAISIAVLLTGARKGYLPGPAALFHAGLDSGERCAAVLQYQE